MSMLNVRDLGVAFGAVQPLSGVSFSVGKGEDPRASLAKAGLASP
jgi:ABC-type branched-subunit amino acid transport system ATPase component